MIWMTLRTRLCNKSHLNPILCCNYYYTGITDQHYDHMTKQ